MVELAGSVMEIFANAVAVILTIAGVVVIVQWLRSGR